MRGDNHSCMGESHKSSQKPCQDSSIYFYDEESGTHIAIVCDGHGGSRYFRSDVGSKLLVDITKDNVLEFVHVVSPEIFQGAPFTQVGVMNTMEDAKPLSSVEETLRRLFSSIIARWQGEIEKHAEQNPLSPEEQSKLKPEYVDDFQNRRKIERNYGCTLIAYVQSPNYWFAFHIGDGKCIMFTKDLEVIEPVLWDDTCFQNVTTSICDPDALNEIRFTYEGDGHFPLAVFLGSDGIDDTFGDGECLHEFYADILNVISTMGHEFMKQELVNDLPEISKVGSKDDMSVAFVYDESNLAESSRKIQQKRLEKKKELLNRQEQQLQEAIAKREKCSEEYKSRCQEVDQLEKKKASLQKRMEKITRMLICGEKLRAKANREHVDSEKVLKDLVYKKEHARVELKYSENDIARQEQAIISLKSRIEDLEAELMEASEGSKETT